MVIRERFRVKSKINIYMYFVFVVTVFKLLGVREFDHIFENADPSESEEMFDIVVGFSL